MALWSKGKISAGLGKSILTALMIGLAVPVIAVPAYWILFHTGSWWMPLFFGYLALFLIVGAFLLTRKSRVEEHAKLGDEMYYRNYPEELKRKVRSVRKERSSDPAADPVNLYRTWPVPVPEGSAAEKREQLLKQGKLRFRVLGVVCLLLAGFLTWALIRDSASRIFSVPEWLTAAGVLFLILTAVCAFRFRNYTFLHIAAALILGIAAWGRMILIVEKGVALLHSGLIECILCFLVYVTAVRILPAAGARAIAEANKAEREWELYLNLFELGLIGEEDLKFQLKKLQNQASSGIKGKYIPEGEVDFFA